MRTKAFSDPFRLTELCSAYDFHWDSSFAFQGESHTQWEMVCVLDGQVEVAEDENVYLMNRGDLICHAPMEFHRIRSASGTAPHVLVLSFRHDGMLPPRLTEGVFRLSAQACEQYHLLFSQLYAFFHSETPSDFLGLQLGCRLSDFLIYLSQSPVSQESRSQGRNAEAYQLLVKTMASCLYENLTLPQLSVRTGIGLSTMKNLFRTYAGMSAKAYYLHLRGTEAVRLLQEGMPIRRIAEEMNYSSVNYFSLCFRKQFGVPPAEYRRQREGLAK